MKTRGTAFFIGGIGMGISIGVALGLAMDNLALGIALGVAIGSGLGTMGVAAAAGKSKKDRDGDAG